MLPNVNPLDHDKNRIGTKRLNGHNKKWTDYNKQTVIIVRLLTSDWSLETTESYRIHGISE